jgi:ferredoxin
MADKGKFKIVQDREACIGCGSCASVSGNWAPKGDKFGPKKTEISAPGDDLEAAKICPVSCIHITDLKTKKKII